MQKMLIVPECAPVVVSWINLEEQLVGVTISGDYILLATVQSASAEKPKQKRRRKVVVGAAEIEESTNKGNGEVPRRRGRKPSVPLPFEATGMTQSVSA